MKTMSSMNSPFFKIDDRLLALSDRAMKAAAPAFARIETVTEDNHQKVLSAFIDHRLVKFSLGIFDIL